MAEVLRKGINPSLRSYVLICPECTAKIRFMEPEARRGNDLYGHKVLHFTCPECQADIPCVKNEARLLTETSFTDGNETFDQIKEALFKLRIGQL